MNSLAKKGLIREVFQHQLPGLIEEIERKVAQKVATVSSNQNWLQAPIQIKKEAVQALEADEVDKIANLLLDSKEDSFDLAITVLKTHGISIEFIVLELIPEIARRLGKHWENDSLSFAEVSIGVGRLERVIHRLDYLFQATQLEKRQNKSILITTFPDSQHTLGSLIFSNYLTFSGWKASRPSNTKLDTIALALSTHHYDALAISVSAFEQLDELQSVIDVLRSKSKNPALVTLVGGALYKIAPEKFKHIHADIKAFTPEESVRHLEQHLSRLENNTKHVEKNRIL
ncbi:B12-binding domain-containing protein [Polynucleobacter antarcticus]|uniref:cobalamin B12-binding domain-containing protein n=1 Tax=Polynucleobacter antarcticus TaxID=1743162 RepID=UPI001570CC0D|nr:cobalamin-dependent protein [Polynucleobacter antarcticus]